MPEAALGQFVAIWPMRKTNVDFIDLVGDNVHPLTKFTCSATFEALIGWAILNKVPWLLTPLANITGRRDFRPLIVCWAILNEVACF